jgi:SAM-dependent methyltransferase
MTALNRLPPALGRWLLPRLRYLNLMRAVEGAIVDAHMPPVRGLRVLDAGCGHGYYFMHLALNGAQVVGVDLAARDVAKAARLAGHLGLAGPGAVDGGASYLAGSLTDLPFADGVFDLVVCNSVLEHIPADGRALAEMRRVLRADGQLVLTVDCDERPLALRFLTRLPGAWQRCLLKREVLNGGTLEVGLREHLAATYHVVHRYDEVALAEKLRRKGLIVLTGRYYLTRLGAAVYEAFNLLRGLDMSSGLGRGIYVGVSFVLYPLVRWLDGAGDRPGYGLALVARREERT